MLSDFWGGRRYTCDDGTERPAVTGAIYQRRLGGGFRGAGSSSPGPGLFGGAASGPLAGISRGGGPGNTVGRSVEALAGRINQTGAALSDAGAGLILMHFGNSHVRPLQRCPGGTSDNSPAFQPQKCTRCVRDCPKRLICTANFRILRPRQKPSILVGYWRARETPV